MAKGNCYLCGNESELSSEHVIPQCLGGALSAPLYCKGCNQSCGHDIDVVLARQFGRYATLLQVCRDRGENQPFDIADEESNVKLVFNGKTISRSKPEVKITKDEFGQLKGYEILGRSQEEVRSIAEGLAKKYNINVGLGTFDTVEYPPFDGVHEFVLDSEDIHRAVAKIAYGFASIRLPRDLVTSVQFDPIRAVILGTSQAKVVHSNYAHTGFMFDGHRPLHKLVIARQLNGLLVGYVALFGAFRYTVLLAESIQSNLAWPLIDYTHNPVTGKDVPANLNFQPPALYKTDVISPKQSKTQVLASLNAGAYVLAEHSDALRSATIEIEDK